MPVSNPDYDEEKKKRFAELNELIADAKDLMAAQQSHDRLYNDPARFETVQEYAVWRLIRECPNLFVPENKLEELQTIDGAQSFIDKQKKLSARLQNFITPWRT